MRAPFRWFKRSDVTLGRQLVGMALTVAVVMAGQWALSSHRTLSSLVATVVTGTVVTGLFCWAWVAAGPPKKR